MKLPPQTSSEELWASWIGEEADPDHKKKSDFQRGILAAQTDHIARRLEAEGIPMRDGLVTTIGLVSEGQETSREYRNSNLLPSVQARNVHDKLQHIRYWMDTTKSFQRRMWVVSWGWVPVYFYRKNHQAFARHISKLAAHKRLKEAGIELVYYTIENTFKRADDGNAMLNLHAHILVECRRKLGKHEWRRLMAWVRGRFPKEYAHDSKIDNAAECAKYVFKPAEFEMLRGVELACLYSQTQKLRFYVPLGRMRLHRAALNAQGLKLRKVRVQGKAVWRTLKKSRRPEPSSASDGKNQIVAIANPSPRSTTMFEPAVIIRNFDGDWQGLLERRPWLKDMVARAKSIAEKRAYWRENGAAASMRHTTTITVPDWQQELAAEPPPDWSDEPWRWARPARTDTASSNGTENEQ